MRQSQIPSATLPKQYLGMHAQPPPNTSVILLTLLFVVLLSARPFLERIFRRRPRGEHTANTSQITTQPSPKHASNAAQDDMSPPIRDSRPSHSTNDPTNTSIRPRRRRLSIRANINTHALPRPPTGDEPLVGPHGEVADLSGELFETPGFLEAYRRRHNIHVPPEPSLLPPVTPLPVLPVHSALPIRIATRTPRSRGGSRSGSRSNSQLIVGHPPSTSPSPIARRRRASLLRQAEQRLSQPHNHVAGARNHHHQQHGQQGQRGQQGPHRRSAFTEMFDGSSALDSAAYILRRSGVQITPQPRRNGIHYHDAEVNGHDGDSDDDIADRMTGLLNGHTSPVTTLATSSGSSSSAGRPIVTVHGEGRDRGGPATTATITPVGPTAHVLVDEDEGEYVAITEFYTRLTPPEEVPAPAPAPATAAPRRASASLRPRPSASAQASPARRTGAVNGTTPNPYIDSNGEPTMNGHAGHAGHAGLTTPASALPHLTDSERRIHARRQAVYANLGVGEARLQRLLDRAEADTPAGRAAARARGEGRGG